MPSVKQQGPWRTAVEENAPMVTDEGDTYSLLRRARDKYYAAANKIAARRRNPETDVLPERFHGIVAAYRASGDKINALIPQEVRNVIEVGSEGDQHSERSEVAGASQEDQETSVSNDNSQPGGSEGHGEGSQVS